MSLDVREEILKYETYINDVMKADLAELERRLDTKNADVLEFIQLKSMITAFKSNGYDKDGFKTQVDIGQNIYVEAHVPDASRILLDVGLGLFVEFTLDEATRIIDIRVKLLEDQIANLRKQVAWTNASIKTMLLRIRELQGFKD